MRTVMNKKEYLVIIVSGITIALSACSVKEENNTVETSPYSVLEKNTADDTADYEKPLGASENQQDLDTAGTWEDAYRAISAIKTITWLTLMTCGLIPIFMCILAYMILIMMIYQN